MSGGESKNHRAGKPFEEIRHHRAPGYLAGRLVAIRQFADDHRRRSREKTGLCELGHFAIEAVRALIDFVEEQHVSWWRIERERRAERREQLSERAAEQRSRRFTGNDGFEPRRRQLADRSATAE